MIYKLLNKKILYAIIFSLLTMVIFNFSISFAADNEEISIEEDDTSIPQIKNIPNIKSGGGRNFIDEVYNSYDFIGKIDDVQPEGLVIGDSFFKKAYGAQISGANKGRRVGIILNQKGEIISCEPVNNISK
ncbi:MAG: hypothetical protein HQK70_13780 [Desulfamplus sp.]|nr:hypothetical protein [Desulfamplus sp.]